MMLFKCVLILSVSMLFALRPIENKRIEIRKRVSFFMGDFDGGLLVIFR
jgi:hypothetical protein